MKTTSETLASADSSTEVDDKRAARYSVPALQKGLDILELLAASPAGLNLTTIANGLGRSTGEMYRILQFLESRDYIVRNRDSDTYSISMRLFHLSHEHPPLRSLVAAVVPIMEELAQMAGQSCHLAVLSRTNITIVAQIDSPLPIRYSVRLGAQFPAWETSSGILLCSFLTEAARRTLFSQLAHVMGEESLSELQAKIADVREKGFEERQSLRIPGIVNFSFPVRDRHGHIAAALTVPFLPQSKNTATLEEVRALAAAAAARASAAIGYREEPTSPV